MGFGVRFSSVLRLRTNILRHPAYPLYVRNYSIAIHRISGRDRCHISSSNFIRLLETQGRCFSSSIDRKDFADVIHDSSELRTTPADRNAPSAQNTNKSTVEELPDTVNLSSSSEYIPEPPALPLEQLPDISEFIQQLPGVEPTFASIGLGSNWPPGLVQQAFEFMHVNCGMPWWLTIVAATLVVRTTMFPLVILSQRNAAKMANNMPKMTELQNKMTEARLSGDMVQCGRAASELVTFMKTADINPFKSMIPMFVQMPIFLSFFIGLRKMANLPVESLKEGGMLWFTDLTIADPFYLLPLITCCTLFVTIELGAESGVRPANYQTMRYIMRCIPIVVFPFTMNFASAILVYWTTSNFFSLGSVFLLKYQPLRKRFKIPIIAPAPASTAPKKGFVEGIRDSMNNSKVARVIQDRQKMDEIRFKQAGVGPLPKTYPFDPTKNLATKASSTKAQTKYK